MTNRTFNIQTSVGALRWMLHQNIILRRTMKDPETYATVQGFILSDQLRDMIGSNLVKLVAKATKKENGKLSKVSIRDAFLTATMAAVLEVAGVPLSDGEMTRCANIIFALLPIRRLEEAGLADRSLRTIARDRSSVQKLQNLFRVRTYQAF
jgi:hypothetical protein